MKQTLAEALRLGAQQLAMALALIPREARIEAEALAREALQVERAYLAAHPELLLEERQLQRYRTLLERRLKGEPIAYIRGRREFYGLEFKVTPAVLIPRPETEILVDAALERIPRDEGLRVLELGTGSGAVAVAIARHRPRARVTATERSQAALAVARENAVRLAVGVRFLQGDWYQPVAGERFDLIVANPPYVAQADPHLEQGDLRFEPKEALVAGEDGLKCLRSIIQNAPAYLGDGGWLVFEHGFDQAAVCCGLLAEGGFREIFSQRDLAGLVRVSGGRLALSR